MSYAMCASAVFLGPGSRQLGLCCLQLRKGVLGALWGRVEDFAGDLSWLISVFSWDTTQDVIRGPDGLCMQRSYVCVLRKGRTADARPY